MAMYQLRVPVAAMQYNGRTDGFVDVLRFVQNEPVELYTTSGNRVHVVFEDDILILEPSDWLVKLAGELEIYTADEFHKTFMERVVG